MTPGEKRQSVKNVLTQYGKQMFFTAANIQQMFGWSDPHTAQKFLKDVPKTKCNNKSYYFINDILDCMEFS